LLEIESFVHIGDQQCFFRGSRLLGLSDFNGDGIADIATGRLPVRTVEELAAMVAKVVSYEVTGH